jgi:uncharacterized membrane protein required for colicin V production
MSLSFSVLDYVLGAYLVYHVFNGARKGFMTLFIEAITLSGFLAIVVLYLPYITQYVMLKLEISESNAMVLSLFMVALGAVLISMVTSKLVSMVVTISGLSMFNRLAGAILGGIKGTIFALPIIVLTLWLYPTIVTDSVIILKARKLISFDPQSRQPTGVTIEKKESP